mmetsp:Transcript_139253/g.445115  ORF Transcript_139253/g.445115 Transcript_139253/m.445115 type:complete len:201 (-) Transcript_139253:618-1220(-)
MPKLQRGCGLSQTFCRRFSFRPPGMSSEPSDFLSSSTPISSLSCSSSSYKSARGLACEPLLAEPLWEPLEPLPDLALEDFRLAWTSEKPPEEEGVPASAGSLSSSSSSRPGAARMTISTSTCIWPSQACRRQSSGGCSTASCVSPSSSSELESPLRAATTVAGFRVASCLARRLKYCAADSALSRHSSSSSCVHLSTRLS